MDNVNSLKAHQKVLLELLIEFDRICQKHEINYMLFAGSALGAVRHQGFIPWDDDLDVAMLRNDYDHFLKVASDELNDKYYLQAEFSEHWPLHYSKLRKNNTTCLEKFFPKDDNIHQGIYMDIFPIDNASNNSVIRRLQFVSSKIVLAKTLCNRGYETNSLLKKIFINICKALPIKPFVFITKLTRAKKNKFVHSFLGGTSRYARGVYPMEWIVETTLMQFEGFLFPVSAYFDKLLTVLYGNYMKIPSESERQCKKHAVLVDVEKDYSEYKDYRSKIKFGIYTKSIR